MAALTGNPPAAAPDLARQPDDSTASPNTYSQKCKNGIGSQPEDVPPDEDVWIYNESAF